jgi:hypothetical protein
MASRALRWVLAGSSLGLVGALPGCSLLLDFDEPLESIDGGPRDGSADDAAPLPDAILNPDAALAANCEALEPNDSLATPQAITPMTIAAAHCPGGDLDFYSFELAANTELTITLDFLNDPTPGDLNLRLYDSAQDVRSVASGTGTSDQIIHSPGLGNALPAGTYTIEVFPAAGSFAKDYSLTLEQVVVL